MSAPEPQNALEAAFLRGIANLGERERRALLDAMLDRDRPLDERLFDFCIACGDPPDRARQLVCEALRGGGPDWRRALH